MSLKTRVAQTVQTLFPTITAMLGCVSMGSEADLPSSFDDGSERRTKGAEWFARKQKIRSTDREPSDGSRGVCKL